MRDGQGCFGDPADAVAPNFRWRGHAKQALSPPEKRAMISEFVGIAWRGGLCLALMLVILQASGLLH
jgi:hypothetical protein